MVRQVESLFPTVMTKFNKLYPQSVVYAIDGHLPELEEQLIAGDIDMFFGYNSIINSRLTYETIYNDCLVAILPKNHPAASMTVKKDTCSYPWLDLSYVKKNDLSYSTAIKAFASLKKMPFFMQMFFRNLLIK